MSAEPSASQPPFPAVLLLLLLMFIAVLCTMMTCSPLLLLVW
jgi:hypothetical protein